MRTQIALILALWTAPLQAQTLDEIAQLEVLPGWMTRDGTHMAGLKLTLAPGWKTYWRAPGDAGIPPQIDFSHSENIASARFMWPVPEVFDQGGMRSIGYRDGVVVPVELTPNSAGDAMSLNGVLDIGICEEICVPIQLTFDTDLPRDGVRDSRIVAALVNRPLTAAEASVTSATCTVGPTSDGITVTATLNMPSAGQREEVVIETADPYVWVSEPDTSRQGNQLTATVDMVHTSGTAFALDRSTVRITVLGSAHAVDVLGCTAG